MRIDRLRIQGFRSLRDVTFEPRNLSVLVGPNNAGKSNMVTAVDLLKDIYVEGVLRPFGRRGGFQLNAHRPVVGGRTTSNAFEIDLSISSSEMHTSKSTSNGVVVGANGQRPSVWIVLKHKFSLIEMDSFSDDELSVESETIEIAARANGNSYPIAIYNRETPSHALEQPVPSDVISDELWSILFGRHRLRGLIDPLVSPSSIEPKSTELLIAKLRLLVPVIDRALERLQNIRLYHLSVEDARQPSPRLAGGIMQASGEGLPGLVRFLQNSEPAAWESVMEGLSHVAPWLEDVKVVEEYDGRLILNFVEADHSRPWRSTQVSDGTNRAVAALSALHDLRSPLDLIEEPENSLHPWAIRALVDACRNVTAGISGKQIVLTTHSPVLVDYLRPEDLFVVWQREGDTQLAPLLTLDPDADDVWSRGLGTISTLIDSGWVRQAIPGGAS